MTDLQAIVLGIVQGLSEFLPISSSGHLILVPIVTGWPDQGLLFDVAVHLGSLGAVLLYFRRDLFQMIHGLGDWKGTTLLEQPGRRMIALIAVGTIPIVLVGFAIKSIGTEGLRSAAVVGWTSIIFGTLLLLADGFGRREKAIAGMSFKDALVIGAAQCLALIPGTSRSGVTMTAARLLGMQRPEAARFSFLLSIPAILAAGTLVMLDAMEMQEAGLGGTVIVALLAAFASAWAAIAFLMKWLQTSSFTPFVIYRWCLGVVLLTIAYGLSAGLAVGVAVLLLAFVTLRQIRNRRTESSRQERATLAGTTR
jgi:undecaprenyl-diphosphatase